MEGTILECAKCLQSFATRHELEYHNLQENHAAFTCSHPECNKSYSKREHLNRHVAAAHNPDRQDKPFQCELCQARFAYKHGLVRHANRSHLNSDKPYQCIVCQLAFKKKAQLQAHTFVHTGVLPFECDVCSQRFQKRFQLVRHQRSHINDKPADTQVFFCDEPGCDTMLFSVEEKAAHAAEHKQNDSSCKLTSDSELKAAVEVATPPLLACKVCDRRFERQQYLRSHLRTHFEAVDERKLYSCPVPGCDKTYTRQSNVMAHYNAVHDDRKSQRFVCPYDGCDGKFGYKSVLATHVSKIHQTPRKPPKPRKRSSMGVLVRTLGVGIQGDDDGGE